MDIRAFLSKKIQEALHIIGMSKYQDHQVVHQSNSISYGNYQYNGSMSLSKKVNIPSLEIAKKIVSVIDLKNIAKKVDIIPPGFINIFLSENWITKQIYYMFFSSRLNIKKISDIKTIVIDYSSPNIAKPLHVGHIRSTIIGDVSARVLTFLRYNVIRVNHIGDWGIQIGMLLAFLDKNPFFYKNFSNSSILENLYKDAKNLYEKDSNFAKKSRFFLIKVQNGDLRFYKIWKKILEISILKNQEIYKKLNVLLTRNDIKGESYYKDMIPKIIDDLKKKNIAKEHNGAIVIDSIIFNKNTEYNLEKKFLVIQKNDGAYVYATTEIACIKYRCDILKADRVIYYVDSRQCQHLSKVWRIAKIAGYIPNYVKIEHHMFGMILGKNGKPFKTRSGESIKLLDLIRESIERAKNLILKKSPNINPLDLRKLSEIVGIGALKYSDLSKNRITDYTFDWEKMLSFDGDTAPYIQYAYARIVSIFSHIGIKKKSILKKFYIRLKSSQEIQLAMHLLRFEETIMLVSRDGMPHKLCSYLYSLASYFSIFYTRCPILRSKDLLEMNSRLQLSFLTARVLKRGLRFLGIKTAEKM